ncbi:MAG: leucine-rich repeat domain-containing protein [Cyanobacteria bacterium J06559_3]
MKGTIRNTFLVLAFNLTFSVSLAELLEVQRFADWCDQAGGLSESARHTVEALREVAGTEDCQIANDTLMNLTELDLSDRQITNLQPLATLTQLQMLYLAQNEITDISPLASLNQLTHLYLLDNQITDISPLSHLAK